MFVFRGTTHILIGLTLGLIYANIRLNLHFDESFLLYILGLWVGSLFPDSDHEVAPAGKIIPLWLLFKHRTFTHSIFVLYLPAILIYVFPSLFYFGLGSAIGISSHILADMFNPTGCPLFYPLKTTKFNVGNIRTGSSLETTIAISFLVILLTVLYKNYYYIM